MKARWMLILLVALAFVLAACGGSPPQAAQPTLQTETQTEAKPEATLETEPARQPEATSTAAETKPAQEAVLRVAMAVLDRAPHLDPGMHTFRDLKTSNLFDSVVRFDENAQAIPHLATEWTAVDDTTWELKIRDSVVFHNGEELTADDIAFSINRILDPENKSPATFFIPTVDRAEAVDATTLRVYTKEPDAILINRLASVYVVPEETVKEMGNEGYQSTGIGSGPFKLVSWEKGARIEMAANDQYFLGRPQVDRVIAENVPELSTRIARIQSGEADIIENVEPTQRPILEADPNIELKDQLSVWVNYFFLNTNKPPFDDVRVRQAVNMAIDAPEIIDTVMGGLAGRSVMPSVNPQVFGYCGEAGWYTRDVEKAKALLAEAGYADGFDISVNIPIGGSLNSVQIGEAIAGQLTEIGVNLQVHPVEFSVWFEDMRGGESAFVWRNIYNIPTDADFPLRTDFHSSVRGLYYASEEFDSMIDGALEEFDEAERQKIYCQIQKKMFEDAAAVPLFGVPDLYAVRKGVEWTPLPTRDMEFDKVVKGSN